LGNLIGPNGEQLTSTDPYNTTVFVGGLSPLIGEDTLRSFFTPFGEIHYVKVPVGKHCGFVQFVRKADAERAIENMQGFPIGGSRIRLSWGRSQYKAAQAAAQAAQTTALQAQFQQQVTPAAPTSQLTSEEALQLIQRLALAGVLDSQGNIIRDARSNEQSTNSFGEGATNGYEREEKPRFMSGMMEPRQNRMQSEVNFQPFSPDPSFFSRDKPRAPHLASRNYTSTLVSSPLHMHDSKAVAGFNGNIDKVSRLPSASQRFGSSYLDDHGRRQEAPISRPNSGTPSNGQAAQQEDKEHEAIQDVNGTLANLNLDSQVAWKTMRADSFAQFRSTPSVHGSTPSP
jgi:RNA recognition motif-containing protein